MQPTYCWIITKDTQPDGEPGTNLNAVGVAGPRGVTPEMIELAKKGRTFKMYDDDKNLYYVGKIWTQEPAGSEDDFGPLDDFGMPNAGCTYITYKGKML